MNQLYFFLNDLDVLGFTVMLVNLFKYLIITRISKSAINITINAIMYKKLCIEIYCSILCIVISKIQL